MIDDTTRTRVAQLKDDCASKIERVRGDARLSPDAKRHDIAKLYADMRDRIEVIRETHDERRDQKVRELEKRLFTGTPSSNSFDFATRIIAARDAADRVDAIKAGDRDGLNNMLTRAIRSGDEGLARACLRRAWDGGDDTIVNEFMTAFPDCRKDAEELQTLTPHGVSANGQLAEAIADSGAWYHSKPDEIKYLSDGQIDGLVAPVDHDAGRRAFTSWATDQRVEARAE